MTLGLPGHLARDSLSRALVHAGHCARLGVPRHRRDRRGDRRHDRRGRRRGGSRAALSALMAILLVLVARHPTVTLTLVYLVVGTGTVLALTVLVMDARLPLRDHEQRDPRAAAGRAAARRRCRRGLGARHHLGGARLRPRRGRDVPRGGARRRRRGRPTSRRRRRSASSSWLARFDGLSRRSDPRRETGLHRASQQTRELSIRHDYELRATARLHDTALSHLVAIAAAGSGPVDERLRVGIRQDLGLIVGRDWAVDHGQPMPADDGRPTRRPRARRDGRGVRRRARRRSRPPSPPPRTPASTCG